jgi:hypothetical protein
LIDALKKWRDQEFFELLAFCPDASGKSKILKIYTEIFVAGLSICEPTIPKAVVIVQIYEKLHGNCREDNSVRETVKTIDTESDVYFEKYFIP